MEVLHTGEVACPGDIVALETRIRWALGCETNECAALRSTAYRRLKTAMLLRLNRKVGHEAPMQALLGDQVCLELDSNATRVTLRAARLPLSLSCSACIRGNVWVSRSLKVTCSMTPKVRCGGCRRSTLCE